MRNTKRIGVAIFLVLAMLGAACSKGGSTDQTKTGTSSGSTGNVADALKAAATKLESDKQPFQMTFEMTFEGMAPQGGMDLNGVTASGEISADPANEASQFAFTMDMPSGSDSGIPGASGGLSMDIITIGNDAWINMPLITGMLGVKTAWLHMNASDLGPDFASSFGAPGGDPREMLAGLADVSDSGVTEAGTETINGIETTKYEATIASPTGGGSVPITVWLDAEGLPRQVQMKIDSGMMGSSGADLGGGSINMTLNLVSYGDAVSIEAPPAKDVSEAPPGFADSFGGSSSGSGATGGVPPEMPSMPPLPGA